MAIVPIEVDYMVWCFIALSLVKEYPNIKFLLLSSQKKTKTIRPLKYV